MNQEPPILQGGEDVSGVVAIIVLTVAALFIYKRKRTEL
jgi:hypothetical protein